MDWFSAEICFHACKFQPGSRAYNAVLSAKTSRDAFNIAKAYENERRNDWFSVNVQIMFEILQCKFSSGKEREILKETNDKILVEHTSNDNFWGDGHGKGRNTLGRLLMRVRNEIL